MDVVFKKSVAFAVFVFALLGKEHVILCGYAAVLIHESAHLAAAYFTKIKPIRLSIGIFGMNLKISYTANTVKRMIVWSAGPGASLSVFAVLLCLRVWEFFDCRWFEFANLCIGTVNLIPALPLDGGILLKTFAASKIGIMRANTMMKKITQTICFVSYALCLLCFIAKIVNVSFVLFCIFMTYSMYHEKENILLEQKLILSGEIKSKKNLKYIAFDAKTPLLDITRQISPSYYIIAAFFEDGRFVGEMNQDEIIKYSQLSACIQGIKNFPTS